jgi:hypothetical protein
MIFQLSKLRFGQLVYSFAISGFQYSSNANAWQKLRDFSNDPKRESGPIDIQKYDFGFSWFGIPTFFHLPVALTPEDLKAGKVEVAIIGAYTDMSTGIRGALPGAINFIRSTSYQPILRLTQIFL